MLGGPDRRTLFMLVADWRGPESVDDTIEARTLQVLVVEAPASGVGWPWRRELPCLSRTGFGNVEVAGIAGYMTAYGALIGSRGGRPWSV
jgi:hypothetical protein